MPDNLKTTKLELTFAGLHRVTVDTSTGAASFLKLAAANGLSLVGAQDYYDYYGLEKPDSEGE